MLISFNFEVHQPHRLKKAVDINNKNLWERYIDTKLNREIFNRVANKCYIPANQTMLDLIDEYDIKIAYSITGVFLEQAMEFNEEVLELFKDLVKTGNVELIGETYHHSLSGLFENHEEFKEDIKKHKKMIKELFGYNTEVFRNTELIYNNKIAETVRELGFKGIFTEGADRILGWRSPNYVYSALCGLNVLLRNYQLSDDIGFRFSCKDWEEYPLTADKYANWLSNTPGDCINIYIDYETFGEHQWKETGIFEFLKTLPSEIENYPNLEYAKPSEILDRCTPRGNIDVFEFSTLSWADSERDVSAWLGNRMQKLSFNRLKGIKEHLGRYIASKNYKYNDITFNNHNEHNTKHKCNNNDKNRDNNKYTKLGVKNFENFESYIEYRIYKNLQTSDNFYYQCTKGFSDMGVHSYFSHFETPYDAFAAYMDVLYDFKNYLVLGQILNKYISKINKLKLNLEEKNNIKDSVLNETRCDYNTHNKCNSDNINNSKNFEVDYKEYKNKNLKKNLICKDSKDNKDNNYDNCKCGKHEKEKEDDDFIIGS